MFLKCGNGNGMCLKISKMFFMEQGKGVVDNFGFATLVLKYLLIKVSKN